MKKYIAIATLIVASIIVAFATLPGHPADKAGPTLIISEELAVTPEMEKAADERTRMLNLIEAQPVYRPELSVKDGGTNGTQIIMVTTNRIGGPLMRRYNFGALNVQPEDYKTGVAGLVTPTNESRRPFMVFVLTSTDHTNWYQVSFGQTFPESEQPRYFLMWTELDSVSFQQERLDKIMAERLKRF